MKAVGPDRAQRSIAFLSFWTYWPIEASLKIIQAQFGNKKRFVHGQGASNINCSIVVFIFEFFSGFHNQSPLLTVHIEII